MTYCAAPFKLGLGGKVGNGRQYVSWITLDDAVAAIMHCMQLQDCRGAVNVVSPSPVTNQELTRTLAGVLGRPALAPIFPRISV